MYQNNDNKTIKNEDIVNDSFKKEFNEENITVTDLNIKKEVKSNGFSDSKDISYSGKYTIKLIRYISK